MSVFRLIAIGPARIDLVRRRNRGVSWLQEEIVARVVYSTDKGTVCPSCGHPAGNCRCSPNSAAPQGDGIVRIRREVQGRKGKTVTTVRGLALPAAELKELGSRLKRKCGSGGSIRNGVVEIQGDHVDKLIGELTGLGYTVKRAGG